MTYGKVKPRAAVTSTSCQRKDKLTPTRPRRAMNNNQGRFMDLAFGLTAFGDQGRSSMRGTSLRYIRRGRCLRVRRRGGGPWVGNLLSRERKGNRYQSIEQEV